MTLASTVNRVSYTGNDSTATYNYTFRIFLEADLLVTVRNTTTDVETTLALTTDYTVTGVGASAGGTIVLAGTGKAWQGTGSNLNTGYKITIRRVATLTQNTDIRNQGDFYPEVHEDEFDRSRMIDQQQQDEIDRSVKMPETVASSDFNPEIPATIVGEANVTVMTDGSGTGFVQGPTASEITSAQTYAVSAKEWARKTDGIVETTDYSSKAWAIGGTDVTDTASRGAAKEWATKTSGTVDTSEFSAKEYAQGTQASTGGSAKNWASQTGADVTGASAGDMSSKEWSVGTLGRGVAGEGSSKDWATYTAGTVDDADFSSKEYAQGTQAATGGSSKNWAQQTGADVTGAAANSRSAKSWSQDDNTGATLGGSAKDWAQNTSVPVDGASGYSSKEWALGTQTRGVASSGSAKDWATYTGGTVDDTEYSAKYYANLTAGLWTPGTASIAASGTISNTTAVYQIYKVSSTGGAVTASTTPMLTAGNLADGQEFLLIGVDDTNTVQFDRLDSAKGCLLNGSIVLSKGTVLRLMYISSIDRFVELSRNT